ncbi:hypothetical protein Tco_0478635 [Tanacetum coccineum]
MYETEQTTIPFPSRLNGYYCNEKRGSYGPQFSKAYSKASHINNSIPQKEKEPRSFTLPCFINNVCFDNALVDLGASVSVMPLSTYLNLGLGELAHTKLTVELANKTMKYPKGIAENMLVGIGKFVFPIDFIILDMPEDIKVPLIRGRPFFLIKRVYMLSLREIMELDLESRLMGETLVINRSLNPLNGDYIELNDLNESFELRRNQGDDLMPTIKEGKCMTRSSTKELLLPFENPEQKFCSRRRLFDTPSLVESNSLKFDHNFDIEELRDNTFSSSEYEDANEHIEKVLEIVNLFHIPKITQGQIMLRAFPVSLTGAKADG